MTNGWRRLIVTAPCGQARGRTAADGIVDDDEDDDSTNDDGIEVCIMMMMTMP